MMKKLEPGIRFAVKDILNEAKSHNGDAATDRSEALQGASRPKVKNCVQTILLSQVGQK